MWATLHAREHNDLDGMTLIPAPKYGQTLLRSWARKHVSDHLVEEWRPNTLGYICLSEGLLQIACCMFSLGFLRRNSISYPVAIWNSWPRLILGR